MDSDIPKGVKRKSSSYSQIKSSKRRHAVPRINILELSDCTLLHILKFLDATSLYQLGETCGRFKQLVEDESLWIHVDARSPPNNNNKIQFCWQNVTKKTKYLFMAGRRRSEVVLSVEDLILSKRLNNLTVLALEHQQIRYCKLSEFPSTIQELSLRHSYIPNHGNFFRFAQETVINLKTLLLDHCQWLEAGSLMSICRYPALEILSLYMCKKLGDDDISSVSVVGKFGFKKLKVIDLRFTGLGDLFLKTFYRSPSLQIIYFQSFLSTYRIERLKRKLDLISGDEMLGNCYLSDDETNNDLSKRSFNKRFNSKNLIASDSQTITDDTMVIFNRLKATGGSLEKPKSFLYSYPYDECTCGFFDKKLGTYGPVDSTRFDNEEVHGDQSKISYYNFKSYFSSSSESSDSEDNDDWDIKSLQRKIEKETQKQKHNAKYHRRKGVYFLQPEKAKLCHKLIYDSCTLPAWCQTQSNKNSCLQKWLYVREPRNDYEISMLERTDKHFKVRATRSCGSKNSDCECGDSCDDDDRNVIVISRNENGSLIQFRSSTRSSSCLVSSKQPNNADVTEFINKLSELLTKIDQHSNRAEFMAELLHAFDQFLNTECFCEYKDDTDFVNELWTVLSYMSRNIHQNIQRVLNYHFVCFQDLLKCLESDEDADRKSLLTSFFKNLSCGENCSESPPRKKKHRVAKPPTDENWDLPGTSGLQSRKRKRIETKKSKSTKPKHDSDSDTNTDKSKPNINATSSSNPQNTVITPIYVVDRDVVIFEKKFTATEDRGITRRLIEYVPLPTIDDHVNVQLEPSPRNLVHVPPPIIPNNFFVEMFAPASVRGIPTNIKELSLRGYPVGDLTLDLLKEMELDLLDVTNTNVTFAGIQQFMMSNPQCRLIHELACVCRPKLHF